MTFSTAPVAGTAPPRIAIVSHSHPSITKGGAEIAAYTLFRGLLERGVDAIFIGGCPVDRRAALELGPREFGLYFEPELYDHFYHLSPIDLTSQLETILREEAITLVSFHHFYIIGISTVRAIAERVPTVVTLHEFLAICHHHGQMVTRPAYILCEAASPRACIGCYPEHSREQFGLRQRLFQETFAEVRAFVSPSQFLAMRFVEWGLPQNRMHIIENGLNRPAIRPMSVPVASADHVWRIGYFGQINPFKGLDVLLDACDLIAKSDDLGDRIVIKIYGNIVGQSAEFVSRFEKAVKDYRFLSYLGPYDNSSVERLMSACDYVLVPSRWWENSPVVIQEAFAARRPVICTGIGGMAEKVIDGVSGLHFATNDSGDLVATLRRAAHPELHARLQRTLPTVGTKVSMAERYEALFATLRQ